MHRPHLLWPGFSSGASAISEGDLFIYSCSAQLISFEIESTSKEINCAEHEYMNMSPSLIALTPLLPGLHAGIFFMIPHLILCGRLLLFSCQMYLESSVTFWYLMLLMDFVWFRNLILNSLAVTPMYVFVSLLSVVVISALYTTLA